MSCPEDTPPHDNPSAFIEEVEPDNDLYIQREITADPFDETQGPSTIFGSPPCDHSEIQDPQSQHNETPLPDNGLQYKPPAMPHGSACPCLSSAVVPPLPHIFVAPFVDPFPPPPMAHGIHAPCAAQHVPALEPNWDPDDQVVPFLPLPPGDAMMTITAVLQRLTKLVGANQCPVEQKPKSQEPETFDGSNPQKLQQFLVLLKLNFEVCPHVFTTDAQCIKFALSYLWGSTLEWFEPDILSQNPMATWMANFKEFKSNLHVNFGTFDPVGDTEH